MTAGDIYKEYLAPGRPPILDRQTLPRRGDDCIHASGGIASVAHPGRIAFPSEREECFCAWRRTARTV